MSSQLVSIVPLAPLTDEVFAFNQEHFLEIRNHQESDLKFLSSEPVRAAVKVTGAVGGTASGITSGMGHIAKGGTSKLFGMVGNVTSKLPGSGLMDKVEHKVEHGMLKVIDKTEHVAGHLVDPTRVVREHVSYSNDIKDSLPEAIKALDKSIHSFSSEIGNRCQELYENTSTKGVQIITDLESRLVEVCDRLSDLKEILTKNGVEESLRVGQQKYLGVRLHGNFKNSLAEIGDLLPKVIKTVQDVKDAFESILANLKLAKEKINQGVTDPNQIFVEKNPKDVEVAWQNYEAKRKTMTYVPYNY